MTPPSPPRPDPAPEPRPPLLGRLLVTLAVIAIATGVVGSLVIAWRFIQQG